MSMETGLAREVGAASTSAATSVDAHLQAAYQRIHAAEVRRVIADLLLYPGDRVLDLACGEGVYTLALAAKVAPGGEVIGVDSVASQLEQARVQANKSGWGRSIAFHKGDLGALPFSENRFDLVWCAQPMDALPDAYNTLRELRRVLRPGGRIALFEQGMLHDLVFPGSSELTTALNRLSGESDELGEMRDQADELDLCSALTEIGFTDCVVNSYPVTRRAPLPADERTFFASYFDTLASDLDQQTAAEQHELLEMVFDARADSYLLDQQDFAVSYTINLISARK